MTNDTHDTPSRASGPKDGDEQEPRTIGGHSLAAAAVCVAITATIALLAAFGLLG